MSSSSVGPGAHGLPQAVVQAASDVQGVSDGVGAGVWGSHSGDGNGVIAVSAQGIGLLAESAGGDGVQGYSSSAQHSGVAGMNAAPTGFGVWGQGGTSGAYGESATGDGLQGRSGSSAHAGVSGINDQADGFGVWGKGGAAGVHGESATGDGVAGTSSGAHKSAVSAVHTGDGYGMWASGQIAAHFEGIVEVTEDLRLTGRDCAESFEVCDAQATIPGTVVVFDDKGALTPSRAAYDRRVAGVVSGAGDCRPAIVMGHTDANSAPSALVALVGKVFCRVDAEYGPIAPGDPLTTSGTPGHAMVAAQPDRAFGAVIGKALASVPAGRALIPILVTLR